ncbi:MULTISPECIES: HdeD family acid-resistance protein [unclassified Isoptericola]|uniref:HdeD family acid-resistance protein n=1 Tax=Isoptericola sp. NPDC057191 TaxID=3346041 RepID=UPI003628AA45
MSDTTAGSAGSGTGAAPLSDRTFGVVRRLWGLVYLRALLYLAAGIVLFANPDRGLVWVRWIVGALIVAQGVLLTVEGAPTKRSGRPEGAGDEISWRLIAGVVSLLAGVLVIVWPSMTGPVMYLVVAVWACAAGVVGVIGGLRGRALRTASWDWQLVNAVLWVVLGLVMLLRPGADVATSAQLLAMYLVLAGAVLVVGAFATGTRARDARKARQDGEAG